MISNKHLIHLASYCPLFALLCINFFHQAAEIIMCRRTIVSIRKIMEPRVVCYRARLGLCFMYGCHEVVFYISSFIFSNATAASFSEENSEEFLWVS